jgi:ABC-type oligopeptide transport system ATPase subunit
LGQSFLTTAKAIIYTDSAKICFTIKDKKEKFTLKNCILQSPRHPQTSYLPKETIVTKKKNNKRRRKNKARQPQEELVNMINTLRSEYDHLLASPFLTKKEDPRVPMIECMI